MDSNELSLAELQKQVPIIDGLRIKRVIGQGGMSIVYEAEQELLNREVAVKVLSTDFGEKDILRLAQEAKLSGGLDHPNIIKVFSYGFSNDSKPYIVMELLKGKSLAERLKDKPLDLQEFKSIFLPVLSGLDYAHERELLHRDIKPANLIISVDDDGKEIIKIVDFGIAKSLNSDESQSLTKTGALLGSPSYMSPEQCKGEAVGKHSDIYSLACVMYESLAGNPPYLGESSLDVMQKHCLAPLPSISEFTRLCSIDKTLASLILSGLDKDPSKRPASTTTWAEELELAIQRNIENAKSHPRGKRESQNKIFIAVGTGIFVLCLIGFAIWQYQLKQRFSQQSKDSPKEKSALATLGEARRLALNHKLRKSLELYDRVFAHPRAMKPIELRVAYSEAAYYGEDLAGETKALVEKQELNLKVISYCDEALSRFKGKLSSKENERLANLLNHKLNVLVQAGKIKAAQIEARNDLDFYDELFPQDTEFRLGARKGAITMGILGTGLVDEAEKLLKRDWEFINKNVAPNTYLSIDWRTLLATVDLQKSRTEAALKLVKQAAEDLRNSDINPDVRVQLIIGRIRGVLKNTGNSKLFEEIAEKELSSNENLYQSDKRSANEGSQLCEILADDYIIDGNFDLACRALEKAMAFAKLANDTTHVQNLLRKSILLCRTTNHLDKAESYRRQLEQFTTMPQNSIP